MGSRMTGRHLPHTAAGNIQIGVQLIFLRRHNRGARGSGPTDVGKSYPMLLRLAGAKGPGVVVPEAYLKFRLALENCGTRL
jgi:hypothetical protein